jgi:hypothetical protein
MAINLKENGKMIKEMELERNCGKMEIFTLEIGLMTYVKAKGSLFGKMVIFMRELGLIIKSMDKEFIQELITINTKVNGSWIELKDSELSNGIIIIPILENG